MLTFSPEILAKNFQLEDISNQKTCAAITQAKYQLKILHLFTFRDTVLLYAAAANSASKEYWVVLFFSVTRAFN